MSQIYSPQLSDTRYYLMLLITFFLIETALAQEIKKSEADSVEYVDLYPTPEGSYVDSIEVNFSGIWSSGWEENTFKPCGDWVPDSMGGAAFVPDRMGIDDIGQVWTYLENTKNENFLSKRPTRGPSKLFLSGVGLLVGPGNYGDHFGMDLYILKPIRFIETNWANTEEC